MSKSLLFYVEAIVTNLCYKWREIVTNLCFTGDCDQLVLTGDFDQLVLTGDFDQLVLTGDCDQLVFNWWLWPACANWRLWPTCVNWRLWPTCAITGERLWPTCANWWLWPTCAITGERLWPICVNWWLWPTCANKRLWPTCAYWWCSGGVKCCSRLTIWRTARGLSRVKVTKWPCAIPELLAPSNGRRTLSVAVRGGHVAMNVIGDNGTWCIIVTWHNPWCRMGTIHAACYHKMKMSDNNTNITVT